MRSSDASAAASFSCSLSTCQERLLGALQIAEVALEAGGQAQQHVAPHRRRTIRRRRLGHRGDVGVPLVRRARQPQELVERLLRRRVLLDRLGPPAEGGDLIDQLVLGDLGQAAQERLPLADVGDADRAAPRGSGAASPTPRRRGRAAPAPRRSRSACVPPMNIRSSAARVSACVGSATRISR